jgi:predicted ATPase with chaperone activity
MKCEICGNEMAIWTEGQKTHSYLETCVSVLLRRLEDANKENASLKNKLAERPTSETKPERFWEARRFAAGRIVRHQELAQDCKGLLAAHDEIMTIIDENKTDQSIAKFTFQISEWGNRWR